MDTNLIEKRIASKQLFSGRMLKLRQDEVELPNGTHAQREIIEHPGAVAIVPLLNQQVVLVRQYRYATEKILLEIPAGKLNPNENPDECAVRELEEETGYKAKTLRKLSSVYTTPGFTNEVIHIYLAQDLIETCPKPDEDEFIDREIYTYSQLSKLVNTGEIIDAKTLLGLFLAGILK